MMLNFKNTEQEEISESQINLRFGVQRVTCVVI